MAAQPADIVQPTRKLGDDRRILAAQTPPGRIRSRTSRSSPAAFSFCGSFPTIFSRTSAAIRRWPCRI